MSFSSPSPLISPSPSPLAPSPSYSHCRYRPCCSRISSQYGCWTWGGMIPTGWQEVEKEEKRVEGRDRESGSRLQIRSTDTGKRWALLHSCTVNDVWEYLLSTLQHPGRSVQIGEKQNWLLIHAWACNCSHTYTRYHMVIHAYIAINIWWHLGYQLLKVNTFCIMHWGERSLVLTQTKALQHTEGGQRTHIFTRVEAQILVLIQRL